MSGPRRAVRVAHATGLVVVSLAAAASAAPTAGELARCAEVAAAEARLACYDALAARPPAATAAAERPAAAASPASPAAPVPAAKPAPPAPQAAPTDVQGFGANTPQPRAPQGPESITARVDKVTEDRQGNVSVLLDNGQTWALMETEQGVRLSPGDPVTIKRAALGSFLMTTPTKRSYHVRRTH